MAEINNNAGHDRRRGGVRRSKKLSTKVDLTPMVDLGFLLQAFLLAMVLEMLSGRNKPHCQTIQSIQEMI